MKNFALTAGLFMGLIAIPGQAANRPYGELNFFHLLNGVPVKIGVLTTAGASTTNATTAVPFTVTGGTILKVTCDAAAIITIGSAASTSYTNAAFGDVMAIGVSKYFVLRPSDTAIAVAGAGATNCAVFAMN